jgi:hypothetical protein
MRLTVLSLPEFARNKRTSLFVAAINDEEKMFNNVVKSRKRLSGTASSSTSSTWCQSYKTFLFVIYEFVQ